jgi:hypothetical protein
MGKKRLPVCRIVGADRDADAGRDVGFRHVAGRTKRLKNSLGKPACPGWPCDIGHQNRKLVAPEAGRHLPFAEHRGDAGSDDLQYLVTGGVSEQVVDFLEPVEIKAEHREAVALGHRRELLVDPRVEMAAIGKPCERIVMRQEIDVLLGVLVRLQIANRDDLMRPSAKDDRPQDQFDGSKRTVELAQIRLNSLVRPGQQAGPGNFVGNAAFELSTDQIGGRKTGQYGKTGVDGNDGFSVANQKPLHGGIREVAHPIDFKLRTALVADIEHDASANPRMAKLAIATPIANNPAGSADCETSMAWSGIIDTAAIAVK